MSLDDLAKLLDAYARGDVDLEALHAQLLPDLVADPLDIEASESTPWDHAPSEARLFWRLVYLFESESADSEHLRQVARRVVGCLRQTGSSESTFQLLPLVLDQDRLSVIIERHVAGTISRTGFLSVLAESGYPAHIKLWLEHASARPLTGLADALAREQYGVVVASLEAPPA